MTEIRDCKECGCLFFVIYESQTHCKRCKENEFQTSG